MTLIYFISTHRFDWAIGRIIEDILFHLFHLNSFIGVLGLYNNY